VIYNSYWTALDWARTQDVAQADLEKATADAVAQLERLLDRHGKSTGKRFSLGPTTKGE
jgi:hypothetical protein